MNWIERKIIHLSKLGCEDINWIQLKALQLRELLQNHTVVEPEGNGTFNQHHCKCAT
jgi:hypothetical protein